MNNKPDIQKVANVMHTFKGDTRRILLASLGYKPYLPPVPPPEYRIYETGWKSNIPLALPNRFLRQIIT